MRHLMIALVAFAAACAGDADGQSPPSDAGVQCNGTYIAFNPAQPEKGTTVRAQVIYSSGSGGVPTFTWDVTGPGGAAVTPTPAASDKSQIDFPASVAGPYRVVVYIQGLDCTYAEGTINVIDPGAITDTYRLRTVPSKNLAPPQETIIQIQGGADYARDIFLESGLDVTLKVQTITGTTGTGVPAYVKLMPTSAAGAFTELFTAADGTFRIRLQGQPHNVLVIPTSTSLAPKMLAWSPGTPLLNVAPGTSIGGIVRGPSGTGLSGAKVQLTSGGVPSTIGTTAGDGSFSIRADFTAGAMITVKVTPPAASGLPRLEASGAFDLGVPSPYVQIAYASTLGTCAVGNTPVRRGGNPQPGARVTFVGTLSSAGTVTAGAAVPATGTVRIAATANGSGQLPALLVPRASLAAVVQLGMNDFAIDTTVDTSTCPALTIDAPAQIVRTGTVRSATGTALGGVRVEATPVGVLAMADAQAVAVTTSGAGAFSLPLASGGLYDVRFIDPMARGARLELSNIAPAGVPMTPALPKSLVISGKVSVAGSTQPITGASIQILCATCTGIDASRPVAETATNSLSDYRIAVPDPGTM